MSCGMPKRQRILGMKETTWRPSTVRRVTASTYFVKYSVAARKYLWPLEAEGVIGPTTSKAHIENGQGETTDCKYVASAFIIAKFLLFASQTDL